MSAQKTADQTSTKSPTTPPAQKARKPWIKKTPVDVVIDQINRQRDDVQKKEEELKLAKRQLEKLEAARKVLETN